MSEPTTPTYHDLHITTPDMPRTSIFNLPYDIRVEACRIGGWQVWRRRLGLLNDELLGAEYDYPWLVLDVAGHVIVDSRVADPEAPTDE